MPESSKPCAKKRPAEAAKLPEAANTQRTPFWKRKKLEELTPSEWESLCDGCGRCCLVKLEDEDSGRIHFTSIACKLLDTCACRCMDYPRRAKKVRDCIKLTPAKVRELDWLPPACAYRLVAEGRDLPWWHPLVSGSPETVHEAGVSVRGRVTAGEHEIPLADYPDHVVRWPGKAPRSSRRKSVPPGRGGNADREAGLRLESSGHLRKSS